jgi:hypothetical protein
MPTCHADAVYEEPCDSVFDSIGRATIRAMRSLPGGIIALTWTLAYPIDASCTACHKRFRPGLSAPSPTMDWLRP